MSLAICIQEGLAHEHAGGKVLESSLKKLERSAALQGKPALFKSYELCCQHPALTAAESQRALAMSYKINCRSRQPCLSGILYCVCQLPPSELRPLGWLS